MFLCPKDIFLHSLAFLKSASQLTKPVSKFPFLNIHLLPPSRTPSQQGTAWLGRHRQANYSNSIHRVPLKLIREALKKVMDKMDQRVLMIIREDWLRLLMGQTLVTFSHWSAKFLQASNQKNYPIVDRVEKWSRTLVKSSSFIRIHHLWTGYKTKTHS